MRSQSFQFLQVPADPYLASLGAAAIIQGGQTMNPSIKEILASFENLPTDKVIILPNNKNIILAANEAASMTVKQVAVIPTISSPGSQPCSADPGWRFR